MAGPNVIYRGPADRTPKTVNDRRVSGALLPGTFVEDNGTNLVQLTTAVGKRPLVLGIQDYIGQHPDTAYVSGDTGLTYDMQLVHELYKPEIGIVCIGDRFTMGPDQAAYACRKFFKFKTVIPCHFATFEGFLIPDAKPFLKAMGPKAKSVKVMKSGDTATV